MSWRGSLHYFMVGRRWYEFGVHHWEHALSHHNYWDLRAFGKTLSVRFVPGGAGKVDD
jgi:hypothetical protein